MKIFTTSQIRRADSCTISNGHITALKLMERAADACVNWLINNTPESAVFQIFCGKGNNGGDGLAIARLLQQQGLKVNVFSEDAAPGSSECFQINYQRLAEHPQIAAYRYNEAPSFDFDANSVVIDALFGTGLKREITDEFAFLIGFMNTLPFRKIAIDIPSGLFADTATGENAPVIQADDTLSFQFWKKSFLHPETGKFCGNIHILDINLDPDFIAQEPTDEFIIDDILIKKIYRPRHTFSHKGDFGKTAIVGGSFGKMGAAVLATKAATAAGSGITITFAPRCGYEILQVSCPEAMFSENGTEHAENFILEPGPTVGIGPGLGTHPETEKAFLSFLKSYEQPLVLDADALNILSINPDKLNTIPLKSIITPHPKEFGRLFGSTADSFGRLTLAKQKARKLGIYIILKDHHTQVITPDGRVFYNITGNPGMAKGGSGDVLLGIITSLLSQHYSAEEAAVFGVWLHGKAGDFAADKFSQEAMLASDLVGELGNVFLELNERK